MFNRSRSIGKTLTEFTFFTILNATTWNHDNIEDCRSNPPKTNETSFETSIHVNATCTYHTLNFKNHKIYSEKQLICGSSVEH